MDPEGGVVRPRPDLSQFDRDLLRKICMLLTCRADRARMSAVCRPWRGALTEDPALLQSLPFLYFHNCTGPAASCTWCEGVCHHIQLEDAVLEEDRILGSHDGGWMMLMAEDGPYLYNTGTHRWIPLPESMLFRTSDTSEDSLPVKIKLCALSSSPLVEHCIGAALVAAPLPQVNEVMFWRHGSLTAWGSHDQSLDMVRDEAVDILYSHRQFYFLTKYEQVVIVDPRINTVYEDGVLHPQVQVLWFARAPEDDAEIERYLVASRNEILMVKRYRGEDDYTAWFRIFRLSVHDLNHDPPLHSWTELFNLDGRMLYISQGSSRCYESAQFPSHAEGVYFKGDLDWISMGESDLDRNDRLLLARDCGLWSGGQPGALIRRFRVPLQTPGVTTYAAPAWVLPGRA